MILEILQWIGIILLFLAVIGTNKHIDRCLYRPPVFHYGDPGEE